MYNYRQTTKIMTRIMSRYYPGMTEDIFTNERIFYIITEMMCTFVKLWVTDTVYTQLHLLKLKKLHWIPLIHT